MENVSSEIFCGRTFNHEEISEIKEIIDNNKATIDRYHNCSYDLKDYKHIHIDKSFVLLFKVNKERNMIYFWRLKHHKDIFKKQ